MTDKTNLPPLPAFGTVKMLSPLQSGVDEVVHADEVRRLLRDYGEACSRAASLKGEARSDEQIARESRDRSKWVDAKSGAYEAGKRAGREGALSAAPRGALTEERIAGVQRLLSSLHTNAEGALGSSDDQHLRITMGVMAQEIVDLHSIIVGGESDLRGTGGGEGVSREDFDKVAGDLSRAKVLLEQVAATYPESRAMIGRRTGAWFISIEGAASSVPVQQGREPLSEERVNAIFDEHEDAPTLSYRYLVARAIEAARGTASSPSAAPAGSDGRAFDGRPTGCALAMRVLQSSMYAVLDDAERADCDRLVRQNIDWFGGSIDAAFAQPGAGDAATRGTGE